MSAWPSRILGAALAVSLSPALPSLAGEPLGMGRPATPDEIAGWDIDVRPDGLGLPAGQGSVEDGETLYIERCAFCHGDFGEAVGRFPVLMGGFDTLTGDDPVKTVGSYWPYASTLWDYIHRAMPFGEAQSLSPEETYAITAYVLYLNEIVEDDFVLSRESFSEIHMPNEKGFFRREGPDIAMPEGGEPCMKDCKDSVEIIGRARIIDVTPEDGEEIGISID